MATPGKRVKRQHDVEQSARASTVGAHPTMYSNYKRGVPRIASVLTPFDDANLKTATQIGVTGIEHLYDLSYSLTFSWADVVYYDMSTMPSTVEELVAIRKRCESFGLRLSAIEVHYFLIYLMSSALGLCLDLPSFLPSLILLLLSLACQMYRRFSHHL